MAQRGHDSGTGPGRSATDDRVAPADLELLRGFVNTEGRLFGVDALRDPDDRATWGTRFLPGFDLDAVSEGGWARLAALRDELRSLLEDEDADPVRPASAWDLQLSFTRVDGRLDARVVASAGGVDREIAAAVMTAFQRAVHDGRIERFRLCARPECGWCFYDSTRNRSGRWCSAEPCADVMKARAYRARQRTT